MDLADDDPAVQALPDDAEVAREGFFGTGAASGGEGAVVPGDEDAETAREPARRGGGLFGLFGGGGGSRASRERSDVRDVAYGDVLPYGVVARVCDAKGQSLGSKIENAPARGYALHDSAPGAAVARTFYVTGFSDGCPRQFTAANVLLGAPSLYEQLHYGPGGENLPVGSTDRAYEEIKRDVCGAGQGKPCGSRIGRMDRNTFFVSAYDSFGNSSRWTEFLIHEGDVIATATKTSG